MNEFTYWTEEDYSNLELINEHEHEHVDLDGIPEEIIKCCLLVTQEEIKLIKEKWEWMLEAADIGSEMGHDKNAQNFYFAADGQCEPETVDEKLWQRIWPIIQNWRQLNFKLQSTINIRDTLFNEIKKFELLEESKTTSLLVSYLKSFMMYIEELESKIEYENNELKYQQCTHEQEIQQIARDLHLRGFRLSEKINGRYTIFDQIK